jgi:predicted permease
MSVADLVAVVLPVLAVLAVGFGLGRASRIDTGPLTRVTFDVLIPCLAFDKLARLRVPAGDVTAVALGAAVAILGSLALGWLALRLLRIRRPILLLPIAIMNAANLPFPVLERAWGTEALDLGVVYYGVSTVLAFTVGVALAARRTEPGFLLRTPAVLAVIAGAAVRLADLEIPDLVMTPIAWLGTAGIPLVLLVTGAELARLRPSDLGLSAVAAGLRLALGLGIGLAFAALAGMDGLPRRVVVFDAAMPAAMMCVLLARRYDHDTPLVASTVLVSTVIGVLSVPILLATLT